MSLKTAITATLVAFASAAIGQQAITYTHHHAYPAPLNNAASLVTGGGEIQVIARRQWVGLDGAPQALWASGHAALRNFGATAGISLHHQQVAVEKYSEATAFFAKSVRISGSEYLGLSLSAGLSFYDGNFAKLDPADAAFRDDVRQTDFLTGFGIVVYRPERYYVGLSLPRLALSALGEGGQGRQYNPSRQYHLTAAALFPIATEFHVKPALLVSHAGNMRPQAEIGALLYVKRVFGIGLNARTYGDMAGMAHLHLQGFSIAYGYQFNTRSQIGKRNLENQTHEIGVTYRFGESKKSLL